MICPVEIRLFVKDLQSARRFYCDELGLFLDLGWDAANPNRNCRLLWIGAQDKHPTLSLHLTTKSDFAGGEILVKLQVENPLQIYGRLKENVPSIYLSDFIDEPFFHGFQLTDLSGNQFQLFYKLEGTNVGY